MKLNKLSNIGIALIGLIVLFAILEIGTRALKDNIKDYYFWFAMRALGQSDAMQHITYDKKLGWTTKSNSDFPNHVWGKKVSTLDHGIRSNGLNNTPSNDKPLILAVGDSFTFGNSVSDNETWPSYLEKMAGIKVVNGGVDGYGFDQIYMRTIDLSKTYKPDILIVSFIMDDIYRCLYDIKFGIFKPYFDIFRDEKGNNSIRLMNVPVPYKKIGPGPIRRLAGKSWFVNFVMVRLFPTYWFKNTYMEERLVHGYEKAPAIVKSLIRSLDSFSKGNNIRLLFVVQYSKYLTEAEVSINSQIISYINKSGLDIETIDLYDQLRQIKENQAPIFDKLYFANGHMTKSGNRQVASIINKSLVQISDFKGTPEN